MARCLTTDQLRERYDRYLDRAEIEDIDPDELETFDEFCERYENWGVEY